MTLNKRTKRLGVILLALSLLLLTVGSLIQAAQEEVAKPEGYPKRSIEYVVGWGAGGGSDTFGRLICIPARRKLGVPIAVVNMSGAASAIATNYVMKQPADGYTLFGITNEICMNPLLGRTKCIPHKDLTPIIRAHVDVASITVGKKSPVKTWQELVDYAKNNPGALSVGGTGAASFDELAAAAIWESAGIKVEYIPFDSAGEMHASLLGGHIDAIYEEPGVVMSMVEEGSVWPALMLTEKRLARFPDVPCAGELGYKVPPKLWRGIAVKGGTPADVVKYLEYVFTEARKTGLYKSFEERRLLNLYPGYQGTEDFKESWKEEYELYERMMKKLGYIE